MQEEKDDNIKDCSKEVQFWDNGMEATKSDRCRVLQMLNH